MRQLALDIFESFDPTKCEYSEYVPEIDRVICHKDGREVYTSCHRPFCGEPPRCSWEDPDNSAEACKARKDWMREARALDESSVRHEEEEQL